MFSVWLSAYSRPFQFTVLYTFLPCVVMGPLHLVRPSYFVFSGLAQSVVQCQIFQSFIVEIQHHFLVFLVSKDQFQPCGHISISDSFPCMDYLPLFWTFRWTQFECTCLYLIDYQHLWISFWFWSTFFKLLNRQIINYLPVWCLNFVFYCLCAWFIYILFL